MNLWKIGSCLALVIVVGCGGNNGGAGTDGGGTPTDAGGGTPQDSGSSFDAGPTPDAGPTGRSFASAIPITVDGPTVDGGLVNAFTKDYYSVALTAGDRLTLATTTKAVTITTGTVTDTVLTLWSPAPTQAQVAQDDDAWPRFSTDSTLFYQVPASGTYYVTIEDCNSAFGASNCYPANKVNDFHYQLDVFHVSKGNFPEVNADGGEQDGGIGGAQALSYALVPGGGAGDYLIDVLDGTFLNTTDTHVFSFIPPANTSVTTGERARAEFFFQPTGTSDGDGSTANAKVWVTDMTGTTVIAAADQNNYKNGDNATNGPLDLSVPVTLGQQYYLFTQNTDATSKPTTDYYFTEHFVGSFYFGQKEAEGLAGGMNDTVATAETLTTPTGANPGGFFVDGDISPATDVDWFSTVPPAGVKTVILSCQSAREGSGVVGLTATLFDQTGTTMIGSIGPETATADLFAQMITVPTGTTKGLLKLSAASQSATNTGTSYLCQVVYQ